MLFCDDNNEVAVARFLILQSVKSDTSCTSLIGGGVQMQGKSVKGQLICVKRAVKEHAQKSCALN